MSPRRASEIIFILLMLTILLTLPITVKGFEQNPTVLVEPKECGEVVVMEIGRIGGDIYMMAEAKPAPRCRFVEWRSNIPEYDGSISNPLHFWLKPNMTLIALFTYVSEIPGETAGYVFVTIKANISGFSPQVKLVPKGLETYVTVPEEIHITEDERWVFVGWSGDVDVITGRITAPTTSITANRDVTLIACYALYKKFLGLWYPDSELIKIEAPIKELGRGLRAVPKEVKLRGLNETFPITTKIPRDLVPYVEITYREEVLVTIIAHVDEPVKVMVDGVIGLTFSQKPMEYWAPRGSFVNVVALEDEVGAYWLSADSRIQTIKADSPTVVELRYEAKPHAWMLGTPIYPLVNHLATTIRGTALWPIVSVIIADPLRFLIFVGGIFACAGIMIYASTKAVRSLRAHTQKGKVSGVRLGASLFRALQSIKEERVVPTTRSTTKALSPPSSQTPQSSIVSLLLDLVRASEESVADIKAEQQTEATEESSFEEELLKLEKILSGESGELNVNTLMYKKWTAHSYELLKKAIIERRLKLLEEVKPYYDIVMRVYTYLMEVPGTIICLYGDLRGAKYVAEEVARMMGAVPVYLDRLETGDVEKVIKRVAERIASTPPEHGPALLIATEAIPDKDVKALLVAAATLEVPTIKISTHPIRGLTCLCVTQLGPDELLAFAIAKSAETRMIVRLDYKTLERLSRCAYALRGIQTIQRFFSNRILNLRVVIEEEVKSLFTEEELSALQLTIESGRPLLDSVKIYRDMLVQLEPKRDIQTMVAEFSRKIRNLLLLEREVEPLRGGGSAPR